MFRGDLKVPPPPKGHRGSRLIREITRALR